MIKQVFELKVLCTGVLSVMMLLALSGINPMQAQQAITTGPAQEMTNDDYQQFRSDISDLMEDTESNPAYDEIEVAIRMYFYKKIISFVQDGYSVDGAIYASVTPTIEYTQYYRNPDAVNVEELARETQNILL